MHDNMPIRNINPANGDQPMKDPAQAATDPIDAHDLTDIDPIDAGDGDSDSRNVLTGGGFTTGDLADGELSDGNIPDDHIFDSDFAEAELPIGDDFDRDRTADAMDVDEVDDELLPNCIAPMGRYVADACRERKGLPAVLAVLTGQSAETAALYQHAINRELRRKSASIQAFEDLMSHIEQSNKVSATAGRFAELLRRLDVEIRVDGDEPRRLTTAAKAKNRDFVTPQSGSPTSAGTPST